MNGIVIVDKPAGWTSQDVTARLRRVFGTRRIGHGGFPAALFDTVQSQVDQDFVKPRLYARHIPQMIPAFQGPISTFLHEVHGIFRVMHIAERQPVQAPLQRKNGFCNALLPYTVQLQSHVPPTSLF